VLGAGHLGEALLELLALLGGPEHAGLEDGDAAIDVGLGQPGGHERDSAAALPALAGIAGQSQPASASAPGVSIDSQAASFEGTKSITRPSRDSMLTFEFPAKVAGVLVRGGQRVKKGDKLIQADDEELRFQVELQQLVADQRP
jgi:multidrug efflux pump subunit AcrA (membrane-fusion protein)